MSPMAFFAYKINAVVNVRIVKIYTMLVKLTANSFIYANNNLKLKTTIKNNNNDKRTINRNSSAQDCDT